VSRWGEEKVTRRKIISQSQFWIKKEAPLSAGWGGCSVVLKGCWGQIGMVRGLDKSYEK